MKKKLLILIILSFFVLSAFTLPVTAEDEIDAEKDLGLNVENILSQLNLKDLEDFLNALAPDQQAVFGAASVMDRLQKIVTGEMSVDYSSFFKYTMDVMGMNFLHYIPVMLAIVAIAILYNILSSLKGKFASESVGNIVFFACIAVIIIILTTQIFSLINSVSQAISSLKKQINIFMPIILTLMTAIGAEKSVAVYQPSVALLSSGLADLISVVILPAFIISMVFTVIGRLNEGVKLKKVSSFFSTSSKWLLSTAFFLFIAFLSVQGITASVFDGISVRTAKFAVSKYVPIIGGYLSEGLNLVLAGSVLVKNAVGLVAVLMLIISVLPLLVQLIVFSLTLHLTAAVVEPVGDSRISGMLSALAKNMTLLIAILLGMAFLYFIFLILIVCTGNLVI